MRKRIVLACAMAVAIGAVSAAVVSAQGAPPTVNARLGPGSVTLQGANALADGPTRFVFANASSRREAEAALVALRPGVTEARLRAELRKPDRGPAPFKRLVTFEAGGAVRAGGTYAVTVTLKPGVTYAVVNVLKTSATPRRRRSRSARRPTAPPRRSPRPRSASTTTPTGCRPRCRAAA